MRPYAVQWPSAKSSRWQALAIEEMVAAEEDGLVDWSRVSPCATLPSGEGPHKCK